ncbi:MAG: phosphotransferase [Bacteroidaceae bacterium]|nr:phosphotransferase [Bacteroidaceae bacterium]
MEILKKLYTELTGQQVVLCDELPGAGSNRKYYRLFGSDGCTLIGVVGTSLEENRAFCYLAQHFTEYKLPVPAVVAQSSDSLRYLQVDLGNRSLFDALKEGREAGGRYSLAEIQLLHHTISLLPKIQIVGAQGLDFTKCYPQEALDETNVLFDLNYFKYCFLKTTGVDFHEMKLESVFRMMAQDIVAIPGDSFMYRDFQARNVMLDKEGNPCFIDFQGGRRGPVQYDVASFLWQASARYSKSLREELIQTYISSLRQYIDVNEKQFRHDLKLCVLFRLLQVLGAYGFRGYFERKKHFLKSIPPAMESLHDLLKEGGCPYPYLNEVLTALVAMAQFAPEPAPVVRTDASVSRYDAQGPLVVRVFSFSYKKGVPEDTSGNGGGYVFDCRGTHNPGRYEPYKKLTGLDEPVIRFLEDDGEILVFLESVYRLADAHVQRYLERGFTSLMFSFGCTGGQHRSVYCAQHLAEHIHEKFGIEVRICHREQGITQTLDIIN